VISRSFVNDAVLNCCINCHCTVMFTNVFCLSFTNDDDDDDKNSMSRFFKCSFSPLHQYYWGHNNNNNNNNNKAFFVQGRRVQETENISGSGRVGSRFLWVGSGPEIWTRVQLWS